jgi:diadenosine tetraphosphate (Ap4A) HIT family hydrolase
MSNDFGNKTHADTARAGDGCRFCPQQLTEKVVAELGSVWAIEDRFAVTRGHHLILPKRHSADWFELSPEEVRDTIELIRILRNELQASDSAITGFNIGMNCGASAGQTIFHAHVHLIPRRQGDTPDPTGGVRGVIPDKMSYPR